MRIFCGAMYTKAVQKEGIFLVATGDLFRLMAAKNINFIRIVEPSAPITLFTDKLLNLNSSLKVSQVIIPNPKFNYEDKIYGFRHAPYLKSIYLDADAIPIRAFVKDCMALIENSQLAVRSGMSFNHHFEREIYPAVSQFNTGVVVFNQSVIETLIPVWEQSYLDTKIYGNFHDQPSFRLSILKNKIQVTELSSDFNFMSGFEYVVDKLRIIHFAGQHHYLLKNDTKLLNKFLNAKAGDYYYLYTLIYSDKHIKTLSVLKLIINEIIEKLKIYFYMKLKLEKLKNS